MLSPTERIHLLEIAAQSGAEPHELTEVALMMESYVLGKPARQQSAAPSWVDDVSGDSRN